MVIMHLRISTHTHTDANIHAQARSTYAQMGTLRRMSRVHEQNAHLHVSFTLYIVGHTCMFILSALLTLSGLQQVPSVPLTTLYSP